MTASNSAIFSVSELNLKARKALEAEMGDIWVEGELSNVSRPASGHIYFTLKDERAQIRCALFRQRARFVSTPMRNGDQVKLRGQVSLFEPRGDYQLIANAVQAAGLGEMLAAYERLKAQLDGEGVFANARPLPYPPRKLIILSSASGAAIRDVLAVLEAHWPLADVTLIPVPVQGADAAPAMISALGLLNRQPRLDPAQDVVLITRGGGSLEDLWAFNNEHLARAIFHSRLPVMSAVGHEIDVTLADFAADARAPTPSAAAERLVPDQQNLKHQLVQAQQRSQRAMQAKLARDSQQLDSLRARLRHPNEQLNRQRQHVTALDKRLHRALQQALTQRHTQLTQLHQRLESQDMARLHRLASERFVQLKQRLDGAMQRILDTHQTQLTSMARELNAISPLAVLGRGYAIARDTEGRVVRRAEDTLVGQTLSVRLGEGKLSVEVKRRYTSQRRTP